MGRQRRRGGLTAAWLMLCASLLFLMPGPSRAAEVVVGLRVVAPYVIERLDGSLGGLEFELMRETLSRAGHRMQPRILPFGRLVEDFRRGALPAFTPALPAMNLPGCLSDVLLVYQNIGLSLRERGLDPNHVNELRGLRVQAFQNARAVLPGLEAAVPAIPEYMEVANQMLQVRALFSNRVDVILGERRIFHALMNAPDAGIEPRPLREHMLFPPTQYRVAFADIQLCADFNRALAAMRATGEYDRLMERYDPTPQAKGRERSDHRPALPRLRG